MGGFKKPRVSVFLYLIVILFNLSSWIDIDGVWAELPLLVPRLPEGWMLPSQLAVVDNIATIGPFIYLIANTVKPGAIKEHVAVYTVISVGFVGCILLMFFWNGTAFIAGAERSVALLALTFCLAFTDNTSKIVFLPYFTILPAEYLSAYFIGESMCGFIPSIASLIQGAGEYDCVNASSVTLVNITSVNGTVLTNATQWEEVAVLRDPLFSEGVFFGLLAVIMFSSGVAFTLINFHPWCKKYHVKVAEPQKACHDICEVPVGVLKDDDIGLIKCGKDDPSSRDALCADESVKPTSNEVSIKPFMSTKLYAFLLFQYGFTRGIKLGVLYNVQSYSLLPYGK